MRPFLPDEAKKRLEAVLASGHLTEGKETQKFEKLISDFLGVPHVLAVTSCTTGLEAALKCMGVGPGDKVLVPDFTYPATASAVLQCGAEVVLVDIDRKSMLLDYTAIEKAISDKTKAVIPVSLFGNPIDYKQLNIIKQKYNLIILEDAACSLGSSWNGMLTGNLADVTVFSLHPRKFITTGEGGLIATSSTQLAEKINSYKHFGIQSGESRLECVFSEIGTNLKLSNIQAALGVAQMAHINKLLQKRREAALRYTKLLANVPEITIPETTANAIHSYQTYCIFIENRDAVMANMRKEGIEVQIGTFSLHTQPAFKNNKNVHFHDRFENSSYAFQHCLALPLFHEITEKQQHIVVEELKNQILKNK